MKIKIGINGFGRIGRSLTRVIQEREGIEIVGINDVADLPTLAHLLKYDSVHGRFPDVVGNQEDHLLIGDKRIRVTHFSDPALIPWNEMGVDMVIESTGRFKTAAEAENHLKEGVKNVILSAPPADDSIPMVILGVKEKAIEERQRIISNASCTTNCAAPMIDVIRKNFGVEQAYITTVHSYTSDQRLHDAPHKDLRRARAAALSMVPTTTGAAKALTGVFPDLQGRLGGCGIRVPVPDGSLTDITFTVARDTSVEEVNKAFREASDTYLKGILDTTTEPLVSADIIGLKNSCLMDELLTSVLGRMVKVVGWYDNEMGYSNRLADLISRLGHP